MQKNSYNYDELISCGEGKLFGEGNAKLPLPPMLMFDRITEIKKDTGEFKKGFIKAELDIKDNLWFFDCHFKKDPVMPGCLGLDAMWQLVGFYLGWIGEPGKGRALGVNSVKFTGEVLKNIKMATYEINMKRILKKEGTAVGLANGILSRLHEPMSQIQLAEERGDLNLFTAEELTGYITAMQESIQLLEQMVGLYQGQ